MLPTLPKYNLELKKEMKWTCEMRFPKKKDADGTFADTASILDILEMIGDLNFTDDVFASLTLRETKISDSREILHLRKLRFRMTARQMSFYILNVFLKMMKSQNDREIYSFL